MESLSTTRAEPDHPRGISAHGYRLAEIATHLGVHYATVSRRLKQAEQAIV
jgi:predicted DNA binding protein